MRKNLKKWLHNVIPLYAILPLLACFLVNDVIYFVLRIFVREAYHHDFTTALDRMIPFRAQWVSVYLVCYIFWIANYILIGRLPKEDFYRFVTADLLSRAVCGFFFLVLPTTNVRPEVVGEGIWESPIRWVYQMDEPTNLFPSIHCLTSWFCYIGIRGKDVAPLWYQRFSLIFAILVCISTQLVKQHYIIDAFGGIIIAGMCYKMANSFSWYLTVEGFFDRINRFLGMDTVF